MKISAQTVVLSNKKIKILKLEEIADVKVGLQTGDNQFYLYKKSTALGSYKIIDQKNVLTNQELEKIKKNEKIRLKIINDGIPKKMFNGKTIIPCDKGGSSDIESGKLSNYFLLQQFFIDWSTSNVKRIKTLTLADRKRFYGEKNIVDLEERTIASRFQNVDSYFIFGITFPMVGLYAPTFRISSGSVFDHGGNVLFIKNKFKQTFSIEYLLGILCSKMMKYIIKNYINNSVGIQVDNVKKCPIPISDKRRTEKIEKLVKTIITKLRKVPTYDYQNHEQIEIDDLVYEIFGLGQELIDEVETWYVRRYPKLVRN